MFKNNHLHNVCLANCLFLLVNKNVCMKVFSSPPLVLGLTVHSVRVRTTSDGGAQRAPGWGAPPFGFFVERKNNPGQTAEDCGHKYEAVPDRRPTATQPPAKYSLCTPTTHGKGLPAPSPQAPGTLQGGLRNEAQSSLQGTSSGFQRWQPWSRCGSDWNVRAGGTEAA